MTKDEARKLLEQHREIDEETGESWGLTVLDFIRKDADGYVFHCIADDSTERDYDVIPEYAIYPDGTILILPY